MGKGSNVQKASRARADKMKRAQQDAQGGGGQEGLAKRKADGATIAAAHAKRAADKLAKEERKKAATAKKAKEEKLAAKRVAANAGPNANRKGLDGLCLDGLKLDKKKKKKKAK